MPEGDTIHRIALGLAPALVGAELERVTTQGLVRDLAGRRVTGVSAHGKHLVIELDDGSYLRTHLGMYGRFRAHDRAAGEARVARMSPGRASLVLVTRDAVYVWVGARTVEIAPRRAARYGRAVAALGPDVLADDFDAAVAAVRAGAHEAAEIGEVLLDQRVASGIGNIWRCEALFDRGIDPRTPVGALDRPTLEGLYAAARRLMLAGLELGSAVRSRASLVGQSRDTRYVVYGRGGRPCQRCSTPIACERLGDPPRWVWWCPTCQD